MKKNLFFASVLLCLMLSMSALADGDTPAVGFACPPDTQCTEEFDPITNVLMYFWEMVTQP